MSQAELSDLNSYRTIWKNQMWLMLINLWWNTHIQGIFCWALHFWIFYRNISHNTKSFNLLYNIYLLTPSPSRNCLDMSLGSTDTLSSRHKHIYLLTPSPCRNCLDMSLGSTDTLSSRHKQNTALSIMRKVSSFPANKQIVITSPKNGNLQCENCTRFFNHYDVQCTFNNWSPYLVC